MARTIQDAKLGSRAARSELKARPRPYYRLIEEGLHLGYRKPRGRRGKPAPAGKWVVRRYIGKQSYAVETIGVADDFSDSDGIAVLNFKQAQDAARSLHVQRAHAAAGLPGPVTVAAALEAHIEFLESNGKKVSDQRYHARAFINPMLGEVEVATLKAKQLQEWLHDLTKLPPRVRQ